MTFSIEPIVIPTSLDSPDAADFVRMAEVRNRIEAAGFGTEELAVTAAELLPRWRDNPDEPKRMFVLRVDGEIVGRSIYETRPGSIVGWLTAELLPEFRNRGLGTALADQIEKIAIDDGRTILQAHCASPDAAGERLAPPTGFGSIPLANPEVRFLQRRGYGLEQIARASRLALPVDVKAMAIHLAEIMPPGYKLHYWGHHTPTERLEDQVLMLTRMSTDAPSAGLEAPEDPWTIERLLADEEAMAAGPRGSLVAAVEHAASGRLAGFTALWYPPDLNALPGQEDTIVQREHRGHRLGTVLKIANLLQLQKVHPGHPAIITFNAEENRHMLDVNESIGFVPIGYEGAWKRVVG